MQVSQKQNKFRTTLLLIASATLACEQTTTIDTRTHVVKKKALDAQVAPVDLRLNVEAFSAQPSLHIIGTSEKAIVATDDNDTYQIDLPLSKSIAPKKFSNEIIDGVSADRIVLRAKALDAQGKMVEWFVYDETGSGNLSGCSLGQIDGQGETSFLAEGRTWFSASAFKDLSLLWVTDSMLILREQDNLLLIYRIGGSFEINKTKLGAIKRIYAIGDSYIIASNPKDEIQLIKYSSTDHKVK